MTQKIKSYLLSLAAISGLLFGTAVLAAPVVSYADAKSQVCGALGGSQSGGNCDTGGTSIGSAVQTAIEILSVIVGVAAVIMLIVGGLKYVTSNGDSNNIASAKNTVLYAIIGLIIAALAQVLVRFVLNKV